VYQPRLHRRIHAGHLSWCRFDVNVVPDHDLVRCAEAHKRRTASAVQVRPGKTWITDQHYRCTFPAVCLGLLFLPCWASTNSNRYELGGPGIWNRRSLCYTVLHSSWQIRVRWAGQICSDDISEVRSCPEDIHPSL